MTMTILKAHVEPESWGDLQSAFVVATNEMSPDIVSTYLVQDESQPDTWSIVSLWKTRDAPTEPERSQKAPTDVLVFRAAGAEPERTTYRVSGASHEETASCALSQHSRLAA